MVEAQPNTALIIHKYKKPIGIYAPINVLQDDKNKKISLHYKGAINRQAQRH